MRVHGPGMAGSDMRGYMGMAGNLLKAMGGITCNRFWNKSIFKIVQITLNFN